MHQAIADTPSHHLLAGEPVAESGSLTSTTNSSDDFLCDLNKPFNLLNVLQLPHNNNTPSRVYELLKFITHTIISIDLKTSVCQSSIICFINEKPEVKQQKTISICKNKHTRNHLDPYEQTKINSKWVVDLYVKDKSLKTSPRKQRKS